LPCKKGDHVEVILLIQEQPTAEEREQRCNDSMPSLRNRRFDRRGRIRRETSCMNAIDTNIWIYRHDTRDPRSSKSPSS